MSGYKSGAESEGVDPDKRLGGVKSNLKSKPASEALSPAGSFACYLPGKDFRNSQKGASPKSPCNLPWQAVVPSGFHDGPGIFSPPESDHDSGVTKLFLPMKGDFDHSSSGGSRWGAASTDIESDDP